MSTGRTNACLVGGRADAAISVRYPVGAVCTCSDGTKTYTARDRIGFWSFMLRELGDWTVTIRKDGVSVSKLIHLTENEKAVQLELGFREYIVENGTVDTDAHPISLSDSSYTHAQLTPYDGWNTLTLMTDAHSNHTCTVTIGNLLVPTYAETLCFQVVDFYLGSSSKNVVFGATKVSLSAEEKGRKKNALIRFDVTALRGYAFDLQYSLASSATISDHFSYLGNVWFE